MTSRRSRLKAVTNLPVRRKILTAPGNANDTASVENTTAEKVFSSNPKPDEISAAVYNTYSNQNAENNLNDASNKINEKDLLVNVSSIGFQNNENFSSENDIIKISEPDNSEILEHSSDLNKTCNLLSCKSTNNSSSVFKPNSVSELLKEKVQVQTLEKEKENEILVEQNCTVNYNNSINNNNEKDEFKCYTVLTSQNVTLSPLVTYTISPLTSCTDNFIDASESGLPQEFDNVEIYTEVEPIQLCISNEIEDNSESVIEAEPLEPVLSSLTNYNSENEVNSTNYENINSDIIEIQNNSENLVAKSLRKNRCFNGKTHLSENDEQCKTLNTQTKDSHILERTISSGSLKVSPDFNSYKQMSNARRKRAKYNDYTKKLADAKREFQKKYEKTKPDRSSLKMIDLIFYNPSSNPMESKAKLEKKDILEPSSEIVNDLLLEEKVDEPEILDSNSRSNFSDNGEVESGNKMPVPQVKIGVDGEIILDEKSLIIETTDAKKGREGLQNSVPVFEDRSRVSYYRGKNKKTKDWSDFETKRFYKALNTIGTDFTLMQQYFPKRSRLELKNKFKREERLNRALIDKALNNPSEFDMTQLEEDLAEEKEAEEGIEMRFCNIVKQNAKKPRIKSSLLSREMIELDEETEKSQSKPYDVNYKRLSVNEKNKKEKEFDFILYKLIRKESEKSGGVIPEISSSPNGLKDSNHRVT